MVVKNQLITIIWLFLLILQAFSNNLLSKFHQHEFKVKNIMATVVYRNDSALSEFTAIGFKYNRTTVAFNITITPRIDVDDKLQLMIQAYKRASNEYRLFPIRFQDNTCEMFKVNVLGIQHLTDNGNFTFCSIKKNTKYVAYNFVFDESKLPPLIPAGDYKIQCSYMVFQAVMGILNLFGEVEYPILVKD